MDGRRIVSLTAVASLACAVAALASTADCGGVTAGAGADAGGDATTLHDGGGAVDAVTGFDAGGSADVSIGCGFACDAGHVPFKPCPATPPTAGSSCAPPNQVCEYGSSWWMECNVVFRCDQGAWFQQSDGTGCTWLDSGGACPATWDEAKSADAVAPFCPFASCVYPQGFCGCGVGCGGGGAPKPMDLTGIFVCIEAGAACPEPRPLSGTPCDSDASCQYGWGCGCGQYQQCVDGVWQGMQTPPCP